MKEVDWNLVDIHKIIDEEIVSKIRNIDISYKIENNLLDYRVVFHVFAIVGGRTEHQIIEFDRQSDFFSIENNYESIRLSMACCREMILRKVFSSFRNLDSGARRD